MVHSTIATHGNFKHLKRKKEKRKKKTSNLNIQTIRSFNSLIAISGNGWNTGEFINNWTALFYKGMERLQGSI